MLSMKRNSSDETYENVILLFAVVGSDYATMKIFLAVKCFPKHLFFSVKRFRIKLFVNIQSFGKGCQCVTYVYPTETLVFGKLILFEF